MVRVSLDFYDDPMDTVLRPPAPVDAALNDLSSSAARWIGTPIRARIEVLRGIVKRMDFAAERWVEAAGGAKRFALDSPAAAEEWLSGPYAIISFCQALIDTLSKVEAGENPYPARAAKRGSDGRALVRVLPFDWFDPILLSGYSVDVWMDRSVTPATLAENTASLYRQTSEPSVCVVLGAGNVGSIPALDVLTKLMAENQVVALKMSPVNDYLGPLLAEVFSDLIEAGFVRIVYGDHEVGGSLIDHPLADTIHLTGSRSTHDAIVWGTGDEAERRRREGDPMVTKPVTSELGGVSPVIVVPGPWSEADYRFQASQIVTAKLLNVGYNCIAAQILVVPDNWEGTGRLIEAIGETIDSLSPRFPYYPGGEERRQQAARRKGAVTVGGFPTTIIPDLKPGSGDEAFTTEYFAPVLGIVKIDFSDPAYFLQSAVVFANNELDGSLGANLIAHPQTMHEYRLHFDQALTNLRYGAIAVNTWTALNFLIPRATWGAYPGHTVESVGSGVGTVHNALLFDRAEKSVGYGPFAPMTRSWRHGQFHLSPPPPWSIASEQGVEVCRLLTRFAADPKPGRLPALLAAGLRG